MICISIAQESRRLLLADMVNAARQCDLIEVRLDRFRNAPEVGEMMAAHPRPVIFSCRRRQDGGEWEGSEEERLAILRQCIISKAEYVEMELDVADQIRKYPPSKRVISYTNFKETPEDIADIYDQAKAKGADVIKLVTLARTPEEAWPLVQILAKPALPTVVVGLGKPGIMLTILGKKIGSPWTYAALERGMETYPGEPTITDLNRIYHYRSIHRSTPLVGVMGLSPTDVATLGLLNQAFIKLDLPERCLPLSVGDMDNFRKITKAIKLGAVVVDEPNRQAVLEFEPRLRPDAEQAKTADLLVRDQSQWFGFSFIGRAAVAALEAKLRVDGKPERPLEGKHVMIIGANNSARSVAFRIRKRGGAPIIASRDHEAAHELAQAVEGRHIPFEGLYTIMHDVVIFCSEERLAGTPADDPCVPVGYFQPSMTVLDLTTLPRRGPRLREAAARGSQIVSGREILLDQLLLQVRAITGKEVAPEPLQELMDELLAEEE
jgi:3-dehydroquinate dehydratase/shikimate dehydrogenase